MTGSREPQANVCSPTLTHGACAKFPAAQRAIAALVFFAMSVLIGCGGGGGGGNNGGTGGSGQGQSPSLTVSVSTQGNFSSGQQGASYNISVKNTGSAATSGTVTVVDPPTGFTVTAIGGTNWTCTLATTTCTRTDSLGAGQSYPPIVVTGNVTAANGTPVTIPVSASGGGTSSPVNSSPAVTVAAAALSINESHSGNFNLGQQSATHTVTVQNGTAAGATVGKVTVTDAPAPGEALVSMAGSGWTCPGAGGANTCDRSDTLLTGASYPPITVTVSVAGNAASPQLNQVMVSGGGMGSPASASDSATINSPDLAVAMSHSGTMTAGGSGTFNISVMNAASGSTAGPTGGAITITDTLPAQFTFVSASAAGWACGAAGQTVTCTNPGPLSPGASATAIPLNVTINSAAEGSIANSATAGTFGDANAANDAGGDSVSFNPDLAVSEAHTGNFGAGVDGIFTLGVSNVGTAATTGTITIVDTLAPQFTFVSASANGWNCGAASQLVTCTNAGPLAPGTSATSIPLVVAVNASASGSIANSAAVSTTSDSNPANDSATDTATVLGSGSLPESIVLAVPGANAGGVIYAGGNAETISITVTNEGAGDVLTPTLTSNGTPCSTCGTLGAVTPGSPGAYTVSYTPPSSLAAATLVTLTVSSNVSGSFPATVNFTVYPAGMRVVKISGIASGSGTQNLTARVFNDSGTPSGLTVQLLGGGYACPPAGGGGTICGTLVPGTALTATTTTANGTSGIPVTILPMTYTPPASQPISPYDRPMILAISNADTTQRAQVNFAVGTGFVTGGMFGNLSRLSSALTGNSLILSAATGGDTGVNKSFTFALTANGADCQPGCGTLAAPVYSWNGNFVTADVTYTPPASVPTGAAVHPVLTVATNDAINGAQFSDSFQFRIQDGTCGTGNESVLNGQYAYLLQGGGPGQGYAAILGSFTADGSGNITGGLLDSNRTIGAATGLSVVPAGSSYSVGADNRGCLTLANSNGGSATYRIVVGALDGSQHATQGNMIRFDDNTGATQRLHGLLMKQDPAAFANTAVTGNYVFGYEGVQGAGARVAMAGIYTADGAGNLSNFDLDAMDGAGNAITNSTGASGTYNIDPTTGRGTVAISNGGTSNFLFYVVNVSEILTLSTDPWGPSTSILSGENRRQTVTSYTQSSLDNNAYVFYERAIDPASGGNITAVGQVQFTNGGANTGEQDINDGGVLSTQPMSGALTIAANGRATDTNLVLYLIGTDSAVVLDMDPVVPFGYAQQQTGGPFSLASLSGSGTFGGGAPTTGASFLVGSANFDGVGGFTIAADEQKPDAGLAVFSFGFSYTVDPTTGKLDITSIGGGVQGYAISNRQFVLMSTSPDPSSVQLLTGRLNP